MRRRRLLFSLAGFGLLPRRAIAQGTPEAGATPGPGEPRELAPVVWTLTELLGPGGAGLGVDEPERYAFQARPDGTLAIRADCNRGRGAYRLDGDRIEILVGGVTRAQCPPDSGSEAFLAALAAADGWRYEGGDLLLLVGGTPLLRFAPALTGVVWERRRFQTPGPNEAPVAPPNPAAYTVAFLPDGTLSIRADCNRARGRWEVDGDRIALEVGGTTKRACAPGSLGDRFVRELDAASSFAFVAGRLHLALPMDGGLLEFAARAEPAGAGGA